MSRQMDWGMASAFGVLGGPSEYWVSYASTLQPQYKQAAYMAKVSLSNPSQISFNKPIGWCWSS